MPAPSSSGGSSSGGGSSGGSATERDPRGAQYADFTFAAGSLNRDQLPVIRFHGREGLSRLFEFRVEVATPEDLTPADLIGQPCHIEIAAKASTARVVHGIVRRMEFIGESNHKRYWAFDVVPKVWMLTRRVRSRIFHKERTPGLNLQKVIEEVLAGAGLTSNDYSINLGGSYIERDMVCQYQESEWDFLSRLMEEEGAYYYFEHTNERHKLVIADAASGYKPKPAEAHPFRETSGLANPDEDEYFHDMRVAHEVQIGKVANDGYDPGQATSNLWQERSAAKFTNLFSIEFHDSYKTSDEGGQLAERRLEEYQAAAQVYSLRGTVRTICPGHKFEVSDHPVVAMNAEYVAHEVYHTAQQPQSGEENLLPGDRPYTYQCEVRALAGTVNYRPPRVTPKPRVYGSQTAIVVGPSGEEIYTDEYGRVKLQFFWDIDGSANEQSSFWARVAQSVAGGGYGFMFLPRIGQEVVVHFMNGDPDHPVVTGGVYNSQIKPGYELPDQKNRSWIKTNSTVGGGGTNEISFDDTKDSEKFFMHATKDMHIHVKKDMFHKVVNERHTKIEKDDIRQVGGGDSISVGGDRSINVGGQLNQEVGTNKMEKVGGSYSSDVSAERYVKAATYLVEADSITLKSGGNFVTIGAAGVFIKGSIVGINSGGAAMPSTITAQLKGPASPTDPDDATPGADVAPSRTPHGQSGTVPGDKPYTPPVIEPPVPPEQRHWVEFQMLDDQLNPITNEPYEVELPDGTVQTGTTDGQGVCRFEEVESGSAKIKFPQRENNEWTRYNVVSGDDPTGSPAGGTPGGGGGGGGGQSSIPGGETPGGSLPGSYPNQPLP